MGKSKSLSDSKLKLTKPQSDSSFVKVDGKPCFGYFNINLEVIKAVLKSTKSLIENYFRDNFFQI